MPSSRFTLPAPDRLIPRPAAGRLRDLCGHAYAHRGLHGEGRSENGLPAASAAIEAGFGIECDVQAASGGQAMVVHDAELTRLTGHARTVAALSPEEIKLSRLRDGSTIPTLPELLADVAGRVPVLVEVKTAREFNPALCASVAAAVAQAEGPVGVMSFDPRVGAWFATNLPDVPRGLVASNDRRPGPRATLRHLAAIRLARPDFLAWDIRDLPDPVPAAARRRGLCVFTWTVRTADERARARANADGPIFEEAQ